VRKGQNIETFMIPPLESIVNYKCEGDLEIQGKAREGARRGGSLEATWTPCSVREGAARG
jgi:hypothetical protein